jgi:hypothetical protein
VDINRLYFDYQVTLMQADRSETCAVRRDHMLRASRIASRIGSAQRMLGAKAASAWEFLALPLPTVAHPFAADCSREHGLSERP